MNSGKLKMISAAVGAGAVAAMGALAIGLSSDSGSATVMSGPEMTIGETTTIEKASGSTPETSMAVPQVTAEVPDGFGP